MEKRGEWLPLFLAVVQPHKAHWFFLLWWVRSGPRSRFSVRSMVVTPGPGSGLSPLGGAIIRFLSLSPISQSAHFWKWPSWEWPSMWRTMCHWHGRCVSFELLITRWRRHGFYLDSLDLCLCLIALTPERVSVWGCGGPHPSLPMSLLGGQETRVRKSKEESSHLNLLWNKETTESAETRLFVHLCFQ